MEEPNLLSPSLDINCISVKDAACQSGYNIQYLRRMLRSDALSGVKIGQIWLINVESLETYLEHAEQTSDRRYGPK
jgi:hypothetical protein